MQGLEKKLLAAAFLASIFCAQSTLADPPAFSPPEADGIIAFSNNPQFEPTTGDIYQTLDRKQFLLFLSHGKAIYAKSRNDPRLQASTTFRGPLQPEARREIKEGLADGLYLECSGAAATSKRILFWELINDKVLWICDEKGDGCFLRIK